MLNNHSARLGRAGRLLTAVIVGSATVLSALPAKAASFAVANGPTYPLAGITFAGDPDSSDQVGWAGGVDWTFTDYDASLHPQLAWGSAGMAGGSYGSSPAVQYAFDGNVDAPGEKLSFNAAASDLTNGVVRWTGSADLPTLYGTTTYPTRFTLTVTNLDGTTPLALTRSTDLPVAGFSAVLPYVGEDIGGVLLVEGDYKANLLFEVDTGGGSWAPANSFFNDIPFKSPSARTVSHFTAGFYYPSTGSLTASPDPVAFGDVELGTGPASATVTVGASTDSPGAGLNPGPVHLSGFGLDPSVPAVGLDLSAPSACHYTTVLQPGETCTIGLTFQPEAVGEVSTNLVINSDAADSPRSVPVSGTGTRAGISFSPSAGLDFGNQRLAVTSDQQSLTIENPGTAPLKFTGPPVFSNEDFAFAGYGDCTGTIAPAGSCTLPVTFTPSALGPRTGTLTLQDNAPGSPHRYDFSGVGVQPAVTLTPSSLSFGQVPVGDSAEQIVALRNTGTDVLEVTEVSSSNPAVSVVSTDPLPFKVAPGGVTALTVIFSPTAVGAVIATVNVTDDAPGSPQSISVTGSGQAQADLAVAIGSWPTSAKAKSPLTYAITLENHGPNDARTVRVVDALPATVTFSSLSAPSGVTCTQPAVGMTGTVVCTRTTMAAFSEPITVTIVTKVTARASGSITNSATVSSATADPVSANNTASVTNSVYGKR